MSAFRVWKLRFLSLMVLWGALFTWSGVASAGSASINLFIGSPPPVAVYHYPRVVYPEPVIVEHYSVYDYHRRGGPPPWAPAHGYRKKHGPYEVYHWYRIY
ncbi:MAG: hypothetical protein HYY46_13040 [Deltaproteobacteria bacterium]|nr:hypothetical protein [Deltaproteobacteria bacterium]